jgi:hypothetical protein
LIKKTLEEGVYLTFMLIMFHLGLGKEDVLSAKKGS